MNEKQTFGYLFIILFFVLTNITSAQQYGRNKVQYETKEWEYIQSEHFDLYYYQGGRTLAEFAASVAETSYVSLMDIFNYKLTERIPILIYRSHNDFTETNVSSEIVDESVGGFTEFFKNRVIVPFDGSYEQFRHVIHHELTHAVMLQFLYGAGPGSIIRGISKMSPPLWFIEGLAEYTSIGWDTESDMYVRDATQRGYLPPMPYLYAFLAYKGGQSVFNYIEDTYGKQKVRELIQRLRTSRNFEKAWKNAFNEPLEESSKKWQRYMRKKYWPEVENRKEPFDYAQAVTDHVEWQNFVNNSPAVSPTGDKIAFLTDRSGYFDIYLVSAIDKKNIRKLVSGQRKADLEELQWLRPGMSWSPDGKYIAFSARAAGEDAIHILNVNAEKIENSYKFNLDGIFSPAWSPANNEIAFIGVKNSYSDIFIYNLDTKKLKQITKDIFTESEPSWSPDGKDIIFVSDRKENVEPPELLNDIEIDKHDYHSTDIYIIHADGTAMRRLTDSPSNEISPIWTLDSNKILYISDRTGISNIYYQDIATGDAFPMTDLITGCAQLSMGIKSERLAFTAFSNAGYDIFLWPDPFHDINENLQPEPTAFILSQKKEQELSETDADFSDELNRIQRSVKRGQDFSNYVFGHNFKNGNIDGYKSNSQRVDLPKEKFKEPSGEFRTNKYRVKFTIDYAGGNFGYDPIFGVYGLTQLYLSDILGNHQIQIGANIIRDLMNSDFIFGYQHLKNRLNWAVSGYQFVNFYATNFGTYRFANRGIGLFAFYPLSRFKRFNMGLQYFSIREDNLTYNFLQSRSTPVFMPSISISEDNSLWGYFSPAKGARNYIGLTGSPKIGENGKNFITGNFDFRRYFGIGRDYSFAFRLAGGASFGKNPTLFIMGGVDNWLNYKFYQNINYGSIQDYFLSNWMTPLRGAEYYELVGTRSVLFNMEMRFPFIQYLITRFPLRLGFQNIQGVAFLDAGSAWSDEESWRFTDRKDNGSRYVRDIVTGFGYGIRANVYVFVLKFDAAWRTDFDTVTSPKYYFSVGLDF